jgi:hypothetical protein
MFDPFGLLATNPEKGAAFHVACLTPLDIAIRERIPEQAGARE